MLVTGLAVIALCSQGLQAANFLQSVERHMMPLADSSIRSLTGQSADLNPILLTEVNSAAPVRLSKKSAAGAVIQAYAEQRGEQLRVLNVEAVVFNGKQAFRVKALSQDSRVRLVYIDAFSGQLLN